MAWTKFNSFVEALAEKKHDLGADTFKVALTSIAPAASNSVLADITQIAATGGYAPATAAITSSAQTGGTYSQVLGAVTWTAIGADFAPFRYFVIYNDTATNDELIAYADYGIAYTLPNGQPFTINVGTALTIA